MKLTKSQLRHVVTEAMKASRNLSEEEQPRQAGQSATIINYLDQLDNKDEWLITAPSLIRALLSWNELQVAVDDWEDHWKASLGNEKGMQVAQFLKQASLADEEIPNPSTDPDPDPDPDPESDANPFNRKDAAKKLTREQLRRVVKNTLMRLNEGPTDNKHSVAKRVLSFLPEPGAENARQIWLQIADDFLELVSNPEAYGATLGDLNHVVRAFEERNPELENQIGTLLGVLRRLAQGQDDVTKLTNKDIVDAVEIETDTPPPTPGGTGTSF